MDFVSELSDSFLFLFINLTPIVKYDPISLQQETRIATQYMHPAQLYM